MLFFMMTMLPIPAAMTEFTESLIELFPYIPILNYPQWSGIIQMQKLPKYVSKSPRNLSTFIFRDADDFSACLKSHCHPETTGILICATSTISVLQLSAPESQGGGQEHILTTEQCIR